MSHRTRPNQPITPDEEARFWNRTTRASSGPDDCWLWTGLTQKLGGTNNVPYGVYLRPNRGEQLHAHRFAKMIELGGWDTIPVDPSGRGKRRFLVIHTCREPSCCNPKHLILGNYKDKIATLKSMGHAFMMPNRKGLKNRNCVYPTYEQAMMIWNGLVSRKQAFDQWGLKQRTYYRLRNNKPQNPESHIWKRRPDPDGSRKKENDRRHQAAFREKRRRAMGWVTKHVRIGRKVFWKRVRPPRQSK